VEGVKPVEELLKSELEVDFVVGISECLERLPERAGVEFIPCEAELIGDLSTLQHPEGVLAVAAIPEREFDPASLSRERPLFAFEELNDPGNLGTLLRTADHFDLGDLLLGPGSVDPFNPKVVRASMGALFRQRVHERELLSSIGSLRAEGRKVVATHAEAPSIYANPLPKDVLLLFGSESQGLSEELREAADESRSLPPLGRAESLNVAISAGIFSSELLREEFGA
jgi:TrmH family RNA methyltransferase